MQQCQERSAEVSETKKPTSIHDQERSDDNAPASNDSNYFDIPLGFYDTFRG